MGSTSIARETTAPDIDQMVEPGSPSHGAHAMKSQPRGAHVMRGHSLTDEPRGAHVNRSDPLRSVEQRALHAVVIESLDLRQVSVTTAGALSGHASAESGVGVNAGEAAPRATRASRRKAGPTTRPRILTTRKRRWGLAPVVGAAGGLALGIGGGAAFAFVADSSATNDASTTSAAVAVKVVGTAGSADLLPGRAGAASFTLQNPNSFGLTFDQVALGATVVSDNPELCGSDFVSIAPTLPFTLPTPVTVSPDGTSGTQSIPDLVQLASNAPSTCQGVTFTVTFTLSGQSS
jgi:hypothetical protein